MKMGILYRRTFLVLHDTTDLCIHAAG